MRARGARAPAPRALGALALAVALVGCSAVLPPPSSDVPCFVPEGGVDPCEERGLVCTVGYCRTREVCNGIDDDLDGALDEGFDVDGDGYSFCGGADPARADCDDANPAVHPGDPPAEEVCDGRDNQCDGLDVDVVACPVPGEVCSRTLGECVTPVCSLPEFQCGVGSQCIDNECRPGDCTTMGCEAGQVCDPVTRACVEPQPVGVACLNDAECEQERCVPLRALGISAGLMAGTRNVCTSACCADADCPEGFACWAPGTGARACVARTLLAMGPHGEPDGSERACAHASQCGGEGCVLAQYDAYDRAARRGFVCAPTGGDSASCRSGSDCAARMCLYGHSYWWFGEVNVGPCTAACRTGADCAPLATAYNGSDDHYYTSDADIQMGCVVGRFSDTSDWVQLCLESSGAQPGASCRSDADCLDRACVAGVCRSPCCSDPDCGTEQCRPVERGDHWEMLCMPSSLAP